MYLLLSSIILSIIIVIQGNCYIWLRKRRTIKTEFRSVLVVIAHPDDECMFFGPTIVSLCELGVNVSLLCLTDGNAEGKGEIRRRELIQACLHLGIPASQVKIINDRKLPDSMRIEWNEDHVTGIVGEILKAKPEIDTVITFDDYGISGHPNHRACHRAAKRLDIDCFQLVSQSVCFKYLGWWTFLADWCMYKGTDQVFLISPFQVLTCVWGAMQQHKSQLVWFRYLYLVFSKYTIVNKIQKIII